MRYYTTLFWLYDSYAEHDITGILLYTTISVLASESFESLEVQLAKFMKSHKSFPFQLLYHIRQ